MHSAASAATPRMSDWTTACSGSLGQGTATSRNRMGNAKCRAQRHPPLQTVSVIVKPTSVMACSQ